MRASRPTDPRAPFVLGIDPVEPPVPASKHGKASLARGADSEAPPAACGIPGRRHAAVGSGGPAWAKQGQPGIASICSLLLAAGLFACDSERIDEVAIPRPGMDARVPPPPPMGCSTDGGMGGGGTPARLVEGPEPLPYGVCTCDEFSGEQALRVDAFDVRDGREVTAAGGSIGSNGRFSQTSDATVGGSLVVAASLGAALGSEMRLDVAQDLRVGGPLLGGEATVHVGGDLDVAGRVQLQALSVGGSLHQPSGSTLEVAQGMAVTPVEREVQVPPPCDCDEAPSFAIPSDAVALEGSDLDLPCARFQVDADRLAQLLPLRVEQSATLIILGNVDLEGSLELELAPDVELELVVDGNLSLGEPLSIDPVGASRVRIVVTGTGTLELGGTLKGLLYAPGAELVVPSTLTVRGAVFVRRINTEAAGLTVHQDLRLAQEG